MVNGALVARLACADQVMETRYMPGGSAVNVQVSARVPPVPPVSNSVRQHVELFGHLGAIQGRLLSRHDARAVWVIIR
jgi:hypothetical protein